VFGLVLGECVFQTFVVEIIKHADIYREQTNSCMNVLLYNLDICNFTGDILVMSQIFK